VIDEEIQKLQREPPTAHELERSVNQVESSFYNRMERVGGFGGKADQLNAYYTATGDADWFNEDLAATARCRSATSAPPPRSSCR
jgi:zinc protease